MVEVLDAAQLEQIAQRVADILKANSQGVGDLPIVSSLAGINSLPALKNGNEVVEAPLSLLSQVAEDAAKQVHDAIADAVDTATHPTYVGEDNYVYVWDKAAQAYNKTSVYVRGEGFKVSRTYPSVEDMVADTEHGLKEGDFVLINTDDVNNPDNATIYEANVEGGFRFLVKMSGPAGLAGKTPQIGIGVLTVGAGREDADATLTYDGIDDDGNPKYLLNIRIPSIKLSDLLDEEIALLQSPASGMIKQLEATDALAKESEIARSNAERDRSSAEKLRASRFTELENGAAVVIASANEAAGKANDAVKGIESMIDQLDVRVAEDTNTNKNFLDEELDEDGKKSLAVRGMDANKTVTTESIPVAGGPLANLVSGTIGDVIPVGTDIQSFLTSLLCKVLWPTGISTSLAKLTASVGAPSITMSTSTVEVGTSVEFTVKNGASSYTATPSKVSGFTYGYSKGDDNTKDSSGTTVSAVFGEVSVNGDNNTTMSVESTGNAKQTANGTASANSASLSGHIVAVEGTNTCSASNTSVSYKGSCGALDSYYGCSNTGNTSEDYKSAAIDAVSNIIASIASNSASKSFVGAYKFYIGYASSVPKTSEGIKGMTALINSSWITKGDTTILNDGGTLPAGQTMLIAVPASYSLDSIMNGFDLESKDSFTTSVVAYVLPNGAEINYTLYSMPSAAEWKFKTIKIK